MRWLALTAVMLAAWPCGAAEVLLVADGEVRAPVARALGDEGLDPAAETPAEAPSRASTLLDEADRAYSAMDAGRALALLGEASAELDRVGGGQEGPAAAARAALLSALALHAAAREGEVDEALRRALAVAPDLRIDPVEYPPWLIARAVLLSATPAPRSAVALRGAPGAQAWIDGAEACVLPCAPELPAGAHRLRVTRAGRRPFVATIDVAGPAQVEVTLAIDVTTVTRQAETALAAGLAPDEALAVFDAVVWVRRRGGQLEGALHAADAARRTASVAIAGGTPEALERACRDLVHALTAPALVAATPRAARPHRVRRPTTRWYEGPWLWIAAGVVLVAGGIGAAVATTAPPPRDDFKPVLVLPPP